MAQTHGVNGAKITYVDMVPYDADGDNDFVLVWGVTEVMDGGNILETYIDPVSGEILNQDVPHEGLLARIKELGAHDPQFWALAATPGDYGDAENYPWGWQLPFANSSAILTCGYGCNKHTGSSYYSTDWDPGNTGHPVYAPASGWVMYTTKHSAWGYQAVIAGRCATSTCDWGGYGYRYLYRLAHFNEQSNVVPGWWIYKGSQVGKMGSTGDSTGAHIHMTIYRGYYKGSGTISGETLPISNWPGSNDSICNNAFQDEYQFNFYGGGTRDFGYVSANGCR